MKSTKKVYSVATVEINRVGEVIICWMDGYFWSLSEARAKAKEAFDEITRRNVANRRRYAVEVEGYKYDGRAEKAEKAYDELGEAGRTIFERDKYLILDDFYDGKWTKNMETR